jgi:hypothetical protein
LTYFADGKPVTWYVRPEIATMFEQRPPAQAHAIVGTLNWVFRNLFYPVWITYNPRFQFWLNPVRDFRKTLRALGPGVSRARYVGGLLRSWRTARARLLNDLQPADLARRRELGALRKLRPLTDGERAELKVLDDRALVLEMLATRAISTPFDSFVVNPTRHDVWGRMLQDYALADGPAATGLWSRLLAPVRALAKRMELAGMTLEAMPKVGGYRLITRDLGAPAHQTAAYVRNNVGTPNWTRRGQWAQFDGTLVPFINIFMQGLGADVNQARGRALGSPSPAGRQRFDYWAWMTSSVLLPRLLQALAVAGVLGAGLKKLYDRVTEYNKTNYLVLPVGTVANPESDQADPNLTAAIRLPEDENARLLAGLMHWIVQAAAADDPAAKNSLGDLLNFAGGQLPGVNPLISIGTAWAQYLAGQNPRDYYRGSPIMTDTQWRARGWSGLGAMGAWTWRDAGGANFVSWDPTAKTLQQVTTSAVPGLNAAILLTDGGLRERTAALQEAQLRELARIKDAMPANVQRLLAEHAHLGAMGQALRSPAQEMRYKELALWHSKVWTPNYDLLRATKDADQVRATARTLGELSASLAR